MNAGCLLYAILTFALMMFSLTVIQVLPYGMGYVVIGLLALTGLAAFRFFYNRALPNCRRGICRPRDFQDIFEETPGGRKAFQHVCKCGDVYMRHYKRMYLLEGDRFVSYQRQVGMFGRWVADENPRVELLSTESDSEFAEDMP